MSLMDKFSTVEIKADNRISEEDKEFCVRNQNAFDKSGPALQKIADLMIAAKLANPWRHTGNFDCNGNIRRHYRSDSGFRQIAHGHLYQNA